MRSRSSGPFAIILMVSSMMAVPLLAIFGVPQFVPVVASPGRGGDNDEPSRNRSTDNRDTAGSRNPDARNIFTGFIERSSAADALRNETANRDEQHLGASLVDEDDGHRPSARNQQSMPTLSNTAEAESPLRTPSDQNAQFPSFPQQLLTWRAAVQRLNELGIRQFRLQPGAQDGEFQFCCYYTPSDNPRITHRFDAEATEPLRAVEKVLDQVQLWAQRR